MKILSRPKGNAEEYGRWSVNPVVGCPHGCEYCYLKKGVWKNALGGNEPTFKTGIVNKDHAFHLFAAEIIENKDEIVRDGGLFMSFVTDPMCEQNRSLFWGYIACATSMGIPWDLTIALGLRAAAILLLYGVVCTLWAYVYSRLFPREEIYLFTIPVVVILAVVTSPAILDLGGVVPAAGVLKWFFPVSYL